MEKKLLEKSQQMNHLRLIAGNALGELGDKPTEMNCNNRLVTMPITFKYQKLEK